MTEVEIESLQSQQRPDTDVYQPYLGNRAMAHGRGLNPHTNRVLEHGSQPQRGQACDQRRGDRSKPPPSPAGSKRKHRRKDATAGSRQLAGVESQTASTPSGLTDTPRAVTEKFASGHAPLHRIGKWQSARSMFEVDSVLVAWRWREPDATDQVAETR
jgi:hypothetical protein